MDTVASQARGNLSSTLLAGALVFSLVGAGCVAGELDGGAWDGEDERIAAAFNDGPAPLEVSEAEYAGLLSEEESEAPAPLAEENAADEQEQEEQAAPAAEAEGDVSIEEDEDAADDERTISSVASVLSGIVGFTQINKTSARGSCGSHAGGVAVAKLLGRGSTSAARAIERAIYNVVPYRPGAAALARGYNRYLSSRSKWRAKLFFRASSIASYLKKGSPVVANTRQWGGHYVTIYGLKGGRIYFSDGTYTDGVSAVLNKGYLKNWSYSSFLNYAKGIYIGFSR